jgi:hypothetical protein
VGWVDPVEVFEEVEVEVSATGSVVLAVEE